MEATLAWTLVAECPIPQDVNEVLVSSEVAIAAYGTFRDSAIFTDKRLIVRDAQGLSGKKVEICPFPTHQSSCGRLRTPAECSTSLLRIQLWTRAGHIKVHLKEGGSTSGDLTG